MRSKGQLSAASPQIDPTQDKPPVGRDERLARFPWARIGRTEPVAAAQSHSASPAAQPWQLPACDQPWSVMSQAAAGTPARSAHLEERESDQGMCDR